MRKDRSGGEGFFQGIECFSTILVEIPRSVFSSKTSEQNNLEVKSHVFTKGEFYRQRYYLGNNII